MLGRTAMFATGLLALALFVRTPAWAASSHQGKVVAAGNGKLTMTDLAGGNQHTHDVAADVKVICEGQPCSLSSLQAGDVITVTHDEKEGKMVVTEIQKTAGGTSSK
ncbi:MAG: hypothetical protein NZ578_08685 [Candidatus Binatia bacterium]|nr:hypothetical protein [Candidatus Binatia bacterium]